MPLEIVTVPCLNDNYAFLAHDAASGDTALIDVPEAEPILAALAERDWRLSHILLTHHHDDHVQGLEQVLKKHRANVVGAASDTHRLPHLHIAVAEGDHVHVGREQGNVIEVSGHTIGHIAFHFPSSNAVFTADSLMALGCGRLFEGSAPQMWDSLSKLAALPDDTLVYSGHEYTQSNGAFAMTIEPDNPDLISRVREIAEKRAANEPTVPSSLGLERQTNPFLRAAVPSVQASVGLAGAEPVEVFAEIRARKDRF